MEDQNAEIIRFPLKLRINISKVEAERKAPQYKAAGGFSFPQRLWEVILDLTTRQEKEFITIRLNKHQSQILAWLALTSDRRKAHQPPMSDLDWFNLNEEELMAASTRAIGVIINRQYEAEINALKMGQHPFLKPLD